jgi:DNA-binding response OmpR family regulator
MTSPSIRVLLVEDEFMIAEFIASLLTAHGMTIAGQAGTVAAALVAIETTVIARCWTLTSTKTALRRSRTGWRHAAFPMCS